MKANNYKAVRQEVEKFISEGMPIKAARIMEEHEHNLSQKQYYELAHIIHEALEGSNR